MRRLGLSVALTLSATPVALAQQPMPPANLQPVQGFGQPTTPTAPVTPTGAPAARQPVGGTPTAAPVAAATDPKVMEHLKAWEAAMKTVDTFYVKADITRKNIPLRREVKAVAQAWCKKPNLARLDMSEVPAAGKQADPAGSTTYIGTGKTLIEYSGADRTVTKVELGPNGAGSHLLLDMISGIPADTAAARFDITLKKQDADYVFLEVKPKLKEDKSDFETMTLVLVGPGNPTRAYMPRMVIMTKPGGQEEERWDFPDPQVNPPNVKADFFKPIEKLPAGWVEVPIRLPKGSSLPPSSGAPKATLPGGK